MNRSIALLLATCCVVDAGAIRPGERSDHGWEVVSWSVIIAAELEGETFFPFTLEEALDTMEREWPRDHLENVAKVGSKDDLWRFHHGFGTGVRNTFYLWGMSPLAVWMRERGVMHPDEMSSVIIEAYWLRKRGKRYPMRETGGLLLCSSVRSDGPPESLRDPIDGGEISWSVSNTVERDGDYRRRHLGRNVKNGRKWAWEYDRGIYEWNGDKSGDEPLVW